MGLSAGQTIAQDVPTGTEYVTAQAETVGRQANRSAKTAITPIGLSGSKQALVAGFPKGATAPFGGVLKGATPLHLMG